jgi:hypothetical protein
MNLEKHRKTAFVLPHNLYRHINTPLLEQNRMLQTEFPTNVHEIIKKKKIIEDTIPIQISLFVYQMSKLWLYKFIFTLHEFLIPKSFKIAYIG